MIQEGGKKMSRMQRWRAYDEGSGFKLQVWYRGSPWGELGTSTQTVFSFGFCFLTGDVSLRTGHPPPLEWLQFRPLVAAVFILSLACPVAH